MSQGTPRAWFKHLVFWIVYFLHSIFIPFRSVLLRPLSNCDLSEATILQRQTEQTFRLGLVRCACWQIFNCNNCMVPFFVTFSPLSCNFLVVCNRQSQKIDRVVVICLTSWNRFFSAILLNKFRLVDSWSEREHKTSGYHRVFLHPPILMKLPFRRMKAYF